MILNQTDLYKIPDVDFKRISINVVKEKKNNSKWLQYFSREYNNWVKGNKEVNSQQENRS